MLYMILMERQPDAARRLVVISAKSYKEARKILGLPEGYVSWVSLTDIELEAIGQSPEHYNTQVLPSA